MHIDQHDLIHEFPEHRQRIHELKTTDPQFAEMFQDYHNVDREIVRIEDGIENTSDEYLETLKKKRLLLKDRLYGKLLQHA